MYCQAENMLSFNPHTNSAMSQMIMAFPSALYSNSTLKLHCCCYSTRENHLLHDFVVVVRKIVGKCCKVSSLACSSTLNRTSGKGNQLLLFLEFITHHSSLQKLPGLLSLFHIMKKSSRLPAISHVKLSLSFHWVLCGYP